VIDRRTFGGEERSGEEESEEGAEHNRGTED
jgi:hypothetical protein